jgi:fumarate hydratase class II
MAETQVTRELWGSETTKAVENFPVSGQPIPVAVARWLGRIKAAAARVNAELGLLDEDKAQRIADAGDRIAAGELDDQFPIDVFQTGSGTSSNMNANEVMAALAGDDVHANDDVNMGQSSNDVFPSAVHLAALDELTNDLLPALQQLAQSLEAKATEFADVVKSGRTHLMDAVPVTLGQEFGGYAAQVRQGVDRITGVLGRIGQIPLGGTAVGTGLNTHPEFAERVRRRLSDDTGLAISPPADAFEAQAARDALVEASGALKTVAISLSNIANNLRWLASGPRCGIGEIKIPELQPGSSIMPGKVNPVIPEAVMMVAAQVVGNDATIAWANALGSNFDLNVMMPVLAYNLLQSIDLLAKAAEHLADKCVDAREHLGGTKSVGVQEIVADEERCRLLIERSLAMCTALAPRIGYDNASAIAKKAYQGKSNVREVALALVGKSPEEVESALGGAASAEALRTRGGYPTAAEIEAMLDPRGQTVRGTGVGGPAGG